MSWVVPDQCQTISFSCFDWLSNAIAVLELHSFCISFRVSICNSCHFWASSPFSAYFYFLILQFSSVTSLHMTSLYHNTRGQQVLIWPHLLSGRMLRRITLKTNTCGICGWGCLRWMEHSGLATAIGDMYFLGPPSSGSWVIWDCTAQSVPCVSCTSQV